MASYLSMTAPCQASMRFSRHRRRAARGALADRWMRVSLRARIFTSALGMALFLPALFSVGNAGTLAAALAGLVVFGLGWGFFDCNNLPILCPIARPPGWSPSGGARLHGFGSGTAGWGREGDGPQASTAGQLSRPRPCSQRASWRVHAPVSGCAVHSPPPCRPCR